MFLEPGSEFVVVAKKWNNNNLKKKAKKTQNILIFLGQAVNEKLSMLISGDL